MMLEKINQRGITWKLRQGEQSFLYMTHRPDLIHIPIKWHEDILNCLLLNSLLNYGAYKNIWKN